eukprot:188038-Pyramimonas_sp.AAC.1
MLVDHVGIHCFRVIWLLLLRTEGVTYDDGADLFRVAASLGAVAACAQDVSRVLPRRCGVEAGHLECFVCAAGSPSRRLSDQNFTGPPEGAGDEN